ncbi:MAG: methionyl-tRNA formyltransferase [Candidatus Levybacteria bacterium]|nr:methionyl-tRNA formyltransferase [Candidatus Levybacteria bacterium]
MKIVLFGSRHVHDIAWQLKNNFDLLLLVTSDVRTVNYASSEKIPFTQVLVIDKKFTQQIKKLKPDLGIAADFGLIIPQDLLNTFPKGILGIHPSLLPKYRGPTPVQSAILAGNKITGLTIYKLDQEVDHGPIIYQEELKISPDDYTDKLLIKLFGRAGQVLPEVIKKYLANEGESRQQEDKKATYTKVLTKKDGYIDVTNPPEKRKLLRMINALYPWPGVWTYYPLTPQKSQKTLIKLLPGNIIQVEGKKPMNYKDFINGYPKGKFFLEKLSLI